MSLEKLREEIRKRPYLARPARRIDRILLRPYMTRTELLNHLVRAYGYRRYLEIGVRRPADNFDQVAAETKHGVDPGCDCTYRMTSDDFFAMLDRDGGWPPYDLIFIDGLHLADQVLRDVENALRHLAPSGTIVLHDCNPLTEAAQSEHFDGKAKWNGTVWKAIAGLRATRPDLFVCVVDIDEGCGVVRPGRQKTIDLGTASGTYGDLTYRDLDERRHELLNLISAARFRVVDAGHRVAHRVFGLRH